MAYGYRCPRCRTTNAIHDSGCRYDNLADGVIEEAHIDIISSLSMMRLTKAELVERTHNGWSQVHSDVLDLYQNEGRVTTQQRETEDGGTVDVLYLRTMAEYREQLVPTQQYISTVWERGPVDGCKDDAVISIISWHEWMDFSWEETCDRTADWLRDTGAWKRGNWDESSIDELLRSKKHIFDGSYGWKEAAQSACRIIESANEGI